MGFLSRIIILFSLFFASSSFAQSPCSAQNPCPDGLACVGNVGLEGEGVCVASGPHIVLCNIVDYFDSKLASTFAIFAIVMIGIAFFLGKISWGMIVSVILGIGIIKGATSVIKRVSGQEDGYCTSAINSTTNVNSSACVLTVLQKNATNFVYNMKSEGSDCKNPLTCIKKTCTVSDSVYIINGTSHTNKSVSENQSIFLPEDTKSLTTTTCNKTDWDNPEKSCNASTTTCTNVSKQEKRDYFHCKNTCSGSPTVHNEDAGKYSSCIQVMGAGG